MAKKKEKITISKTYERKVSLKYITSQYDNISLGSFASKEIEYESDEQINNEMALLSDLVRKETENDIKNACKELLEIRDDGNNAIVLGTGSTLDGVDVNEKQDDKESEESEDNKKESKKIKEEVSKVKNKKSEELDSFIDDLLGDDNIFENDKNKKTPSNPEEIDIDDFDPSDYEGDF